MKCPQCQGEFAPKTSRANRAAKLGLPLYCGRACAGLARRRKVPLTEAERKAAKSTYDAQRRIDKAEEIKAYKAAHFKLTYDPVKAAEERKKTMARHVAYCRTPEYKAKKSEYDKRKKFEAYGAFADAARLLEEVEREISARATRYEIYIANGRYTRSAQQRRRELWQTIRSNRT